MTPPRARSGARFFTLGTHAYAVAIDHIDNEVSDRHEGQMMIAIDPNGGADALFADEHGGRSSTFTITARSATGVRVGVFADGELVWIITVTGANAIYKGQPVVIDWGPMYDGMV